MDRSATDGGSGAARANSLANVERFTKGYTEMRFGTILTAALTALASFLLAAPASAQTTIPLKIETIPFDAGSEVFYAKDMGFFAKGGLDVTITPINNGPAIAAAVASGAVDIGFSNPLSIAVAYKRGLPFVFISPAAMYSSKSPSTTLMVLKDSPIKTAADLNGKTVGINGLKSISQYGPAIWIEKNGGDASSVKWVEIPPAEGPEALQSHRVDALIIAEPQITQARATSRVLANAYDAIGVDYMLAGYFTSRTWADANPEALRRFVAVMRETAKWANANPDKSAAILAKYTSLDPSIIAQSSRAQFGDTLTPAMIQPLIDLAAHYGAIQAFPAQELIYPVKR